MPTNRTRRKRGKAPDDYELMAYHVQIGDCLLAGAGLGCACGIRGEDGIEREDLIRQIKERVKNGNE